MSTQGEVLRNPVNGSSEQTWDGFSWPAFFFGVFWLLAKGLWGHFVIAGLIVLVTAGFAAPIVWIVYGFSGNAAHKASFLKKGYLTETQWKKKEQGEGATPLQQPAQTGQRDHAAQLKDLVDLRDRNVLTADEFDRQKAKLLG